MRIVTPLDQLAQEFVAETLSKNLDFQEQYCRSLLKPKLHTKLIFECGLGILNTGMKLNHI